MEKVFLIGFCFFISAISSCAATVQINDNKTMLEMVNKGASPIDAKCAVKGNERDGICAIRATKF